jgi:PleD family two-component response regulator
MGQTKRLCIRADRNGTDAVSAVLIDIDHVKQINDTPGHNQRNTDWGSSSNTGSGLWVAPR